MSEESFDFKNTLVENNQVYQSIAKIMKITETCGNLTSVFTHKEDAFTNEEFEDYSIIIREMY